MLKGMVQKVVGTRFQREMKRMQPTVDEIKRHEERLAGISEDELKAQTEVFRERIRERTRELEERIETLRDERRHTEESASPENSRSSWIMRRTSPTRTICSSRARSESFITVPPSSLRYGCDSQRGLRPLP